MIFFTESVGALSQLFLPICAIIIMKSIKYFKWLQCPAHMQHHEVAPKFYFRLSLVGLACCVL